MITYFREFVVTYGRKIPRKLISLAKINPYNITMRALHLYKTMFSNDVTYLEDKDDRAYP